MALPTDLPRRVHLLGAGGAGLSGVARILAAQGHGITGHDRAPSAFLEALAAVLPSGATALALGESRAELLPADAELVARSAAVPDDDPQVLEARRRGLPVLKYAELLARVAPPRRTLAVAGTHGKTTSSWMLFELLRGVAEAAPGSPEPGALVGGLHGRLGTNAVAPAPGGWFAVEACEYDRTFLRLAPEGALVTNVEADHLDYYGTLEAIHEAFARFVDRVHPDGLVVVGREVPASVREAAACPVWRLGTDFDVDLLGEERGRFRFRLRGPGWATPAVALPVPGSFNVDNAALALALAVGLVARRLGIEPREAARTACAALERFPGVGRRFERWGSPGGIEVVHDYAHHPTEVRATLEAARRAYPERAVHVLFQPHQHSRTARFLADFVEALRGADRVVVAEVYGARKHIDVREPLGSRELVTRLARAGVDASYGGAASEAARAFVAGLPGGAAALVLGAGDIDLIRDDLLHDLALRGAPLRGSLR